MLSGAGCAACVNATECGCNWMAEPGGGFCRACALNKTIPDLSIAGNRERWITRRGGQEAGRSIRCSPSACRSAPRPNPGDEIGIAFDFLADPLIGGAPTASMC